MGVSYCINRETKKFKKLSDFTRKEKEYIKMRNNYDRISKSTPNAQNCMSSERTIAYLRKFRVSRKEAKSKNS